MTDQLPPPEIRKACMILGLAPKKLSIQLVLHYWRKQTRAHDCADDQEAASYLNNAKDTLIRWMRENPNQGGDPNQPAGVPRRPLPGAGSIPVALPLPESDSETGL